MRQGRAVSGPAGENVQVARAAGVVGGATAMSRVTGYVRDMIIAYLFGAGMEADAFFVAFRIPNLLRRLFGEGSLTVSFIPVFTDHLAHRTKAEAKRLVDITFTLLATILVAVVAAGVLLSPAIIKVLAPGFSRTPEQFGLAVKLLRIMFPYVFFICLVALAMGVLNALRKFFAPAFAPVLLNLTMIAFALVVGRFLERPILSLAIGVAAAGVLQLAFQAPFVSRTGFLPRLNFDFRNPEVIKVVALMVPSVLGLAVYNINVLISNFLASMIGKGSISYLYYADRLMELPMGVFAIAMGTAVMPSLSRQASLARYDEMKDTISFGMRIVSAIVVPAMAGLIVLRKPIVNVLFQRGAFDAEAARQTAWTLAFYAVGLWGFSAARIVVPAFYSLKDFWTPAKVAVVAMIVNLAAGLILVGPLESSAWPALSSLTARINLFGPMRHAGIALATSLASFVQVMILIVLLRKRLGPIGLRRILASLAKAAIASGLMAAAAWGVASFFDWEGPGATVKKLAALALAIGLGLAVYVGAAVLLKSEEVLAILGPAIGRIKERGRGREQG